MTRAKQGEAVGVGGVVRGWECAVFISVFSLFLGNYLCFDFSSPRGFHFFGGFTFGRSLWLRGFVDLFWLWGCRVKREDALIHSSWITTAIIIT